MAIFSAEDHARAVAAFEAAPFEPGRWDEAFDLLARAGGGWATQLVGLTEAEGLVFDLVTNVPPDALAEWERRGGAVTEINPRAAILWADPFAILTDDDVSTAEMRARSPFYQEVYRPFEADFAMMGRLGHHGDIRAGVAVIRSARQGHAGRTDRERLARLLPHVDAALRLQLQLNRRDIAATVASLDAIAIPAFLCNPWGRLAAVGAAGEALLSRGDLLAVQSGRLVAADRLGDGDLQAALRLATSRPGEWPKRVRQSTLLLQGHDGARRRIDVAPLPRDALHATNEAACLVVVPAPQPVADPASLLQKAYGLTRAEAAVAIDLAQGVAAPAIAARRGVSVATVKVQTQAILHKTGCAKASALAAMIGRLNL